MKLCHIMGGIMHSLKGQGQRLIMPLSLKSLQKIGMELLRQSWTAWTDAYLELRGCCILFIPFFFLTECSIIIKGNLIKDKGMTKIKSLSGKWWDWAFCVFTNPERMLGWNQHHRFTPLILPHTVKSFRISNKNRNDRISAAVNITRCTLQQT